LSLLSFESADVAFHSMVDLCTVAEDSTWMAESASVGVDFEPRTKDFTRLGSRTPKNCAKRQMCPPSKQSDHSGFAKGSHARTRARRYDRSQKFEVLWGVPDIVQEHIHEVSFPTLVEILEIEHAQEEYEIELVQEEPQEEHLSNLDFNHFLARWVKWEDKHMTGLCFVCMDEKDLLVLDCKHGFCMECLLEQLFARWTGPRVTFNYMKCGLCRAVLAHKELGSILREHNTLHCQAVEVARRKFCSDGLDQELCKSLGRSATKQELLDHAEQDMAVYMCCDCHKPYCGGRVDCAEQQDVVAANLRCKECEWARLSSENDHRCMIHGHNYAIWKCDSCCSVATWNCVEHHYCERCHRNPWHGKQYPCPGPGLCPLGIPHPRNVDANLTRARRSRKAHRSFVLGCVACRCGGALEEETRPAEDNINQFGYPERDWFAFSSGAEVLATLGADEVQDRLREHHRRAPQGGSTVERAERLLLREQGWLSPIALLSAMGGASLGGRAIGERLMAVGLPSDGLNLERARRLLLLRTVSVKAMLRAALTGKPSNIAAVVCCLPAGQADFAHSLITDEERASQNLQQEQIHHLSWGRWQISNELITLNTPLPRAQACKEKRHLSKEVKRALIAARERRLTKRLLDLERRRCTQDRASADFMELYTVY